MADIKPISTLVSDATVASADQFIINKSQGGTFKTSVILPGNLGPQLADFIALGDLSNVNTANAAVGNVLKWDGTNWVPGTGGGGSGGGRDDGSTWMTDNLKAARATRGVAGSREGRTRGGADRG